MTSQVPLKVEGERVLWLGTLTVPAAGTPAPRALEFGAVAMLVDRVRAADSRFAFDDTRADKVIEVRGRLDSLPLAIKLAAARTPLLGLSAVAAQLRRSLRLLGGGARDAPTRQQTLRATLEWSHGLLAADEQAVFHRIGVFARGFTLEMAQTVVADASIDRWSVVERLATLAERSLVEADQRGDEPRYRLLASAHEYASVRLDAAGMALAAEAGADGFGDFLRKCRAAALLAARDVAQARAALGELFDLCRPADSDSVPFYCDAYVLLALCEGRHDDALRLAGFANATCARLGLPRGPSLTSTGRRARRCARRRERGGSRAASVA